MQLARIDDSLVGKTLGRNIVSGNGSTLLKSGTIITNLLAERLLKLGYQRVYILDGQYDEVEIEDALSAVTKSKALSVISGLATTMTDNGLARRFVLTPITEVVESMMGEVTNSPLTIAACADLRSYDEYTFHHSVNTAVIALQLGRRAGLPKERLRDLGLGALLHDVGKLLMPIEVINKPGKLTDEEYDLMKNHPTLGWESLKVYSTLGAVVRSAALQHHERYDGKGYPKGLKGDDICWIGRYVAVADVFDALTSDRPYRKAMPNDLVLKRFMPADEPAFDPEILKCLHGISCPYPPGTLVNLSDGARAMVIRINERDTYRPVIKREDTGEILDLSADIPLGIIDSHATADWVN